MMPSTCGAYDESLYRSAQQTMPVPPSTPSNSSRNQGRVGNSTPEQENASGQGMSGMPPFAGGKGACNICREVPDLDRVGLSKEMCFKGLLGFSKVKDLRCLQTDLVFQ